MNTSTLPQLLVKIQNLCDRTLGHEQSGEGLRCVCTKGIHGSLEKV